jgi:RNA polymerase sigma-70 factor (ECF subfamily)
MAENEQEATADDHVGGQSGQGPDTPLSLLERLRANNGDAWRRLMDLYQPLVRFWCRRAGLRGEDAEDVTQEVFAAVAAGLEGFRHDRPGDTFRGWLRGITRNQAVNHFRRNHGRPEAEGGSDAWWQLQNIADPLDGEDDAEREAIAQVYQRLLDQVRCQFEERTWQAFWKTAVEGHTPSALAGRLGMTPAAIRQAKSRVLRRLKQETGELLP